jgi:glycosyltransferase involved in cell wall biosynthesis
LAEHGWTVRFLGTGARGAGALRFPANERIYVHQMRFCRPGWRQKLHYIYFHLWCIGWLIRWRPALVYASDLFAAPLAWFVSAVLRLPVVFHEHDSPSPLPSGAFLKFCHWMRRCSAGRAAICVLPNSQRAADFTSALGSREPLVVWNCPRLKEVSSRRGPIQDDRFRLLYHGSIVPERLPLAVVEALQELPEGVSLTVIGYETAGSTGYLDRMRERAAELGVGHRLRIVGTLAQREEMMEECRGHDVGLAFMPRGAEDPNLRAMTGASNKPFDYLACGLALIVSELPDWEAMFVRPGYGISCDPASSRSIAAAVHSLYSRPEELRSIGERGRQRIQEDWNYEHQFQPVLDMLSSRCASAATASDRAAIMQSKPYRMNSE